MKLLLVHAWNEKDTSYRGRLSGLFTYPSLTLAAIYPLIPEDKFERIDVADERAQTVSYDKEKYDLVMISFDTSSSLTAYKHCREFKERGAYVACGGYHTSALPSEVLEHCDTVIVGPAEKAVPNFIDDFLKGCPKEYYEDRDVCAAEFPVPARDKITMRKTLGVPAIIADRGCNNCCKYCSMSTMWKSSPRPVEDVVEEIRGLKTRLLVFYDPNFFADREYALALMRAMKPLKILWASTATVAFGKDDELMREAYESGCRGVLVGLESMNQGSLRGVGKLFNDTDRYREMVDNIHRHGIAVNGCFVMGFDSDTEEELLALPERIDSLGIDLCVISVLTPYPGTRIFEEYDKAGRLITKDWSRYNQHNTVFRPANLSPERLDEIYRRAWKEAYTWKRVFKRSFSSPLARRPAGFILLGANIGFKFLGIDKEHKK